ncbi:hypothetical protein CABS02_13370 [Colletotrichum abscissum]|uniref:Uncharacterized protein n=1 Tax=Colletotrichum abscissum TaxID=1671311 RepID=A0A9Q0AZ97_9PEZI|nr:hypothetical protein CABS02_13370 [Colletotrichum abscissum]
MSFLHKLAFLLLIGLNGLPFFVPWLAQKLARHKVSPMFLNSMLLQFIDSFQEGLIGQLKPVLQKFVFEIRSEDGIDSTNRITKVDALINVIRIFAVKLPSVGVTLFLVIPKTATSIPFFTLAIATWYAIFFGPARTVQKMKSNRNKVVFEGESDPEKWQEDYLLLLSRLSARSLSWSLMRNVGFLLFERFSPGSDPALMVHLVHQVVALEKVMLKLIQSYTKAQGLFKALAEGKLSSQSLERLRAVSNRSRVVLTTAHNFVMSVYCIRNFYGWAWKHPVERPLLSVTDRSCHGSRVAIYRTMVGEWIAEKFKLGSHTMRRCLQRGALSATTQETRPFLDATLPRYAVAAV